MSTYLEACARALSEQGRVGKNIPGFKERVGQQQLAGAIAANIEAQTSLVAEAGTGVGKTFATIGNRRAELIVLRFFLFLCEQQNRNPVVLGAGSVAFAERE